LNFGVINLVRAFSKDVLYIQANDLVEREHVFERIGIRIINNGQYLYVYSIVQSNFNVEMECISYQPLCFDHKLSGEELIRFETEMKSYLIKNPAYKN